MELEALQENLNEFINRQAFVVAFCPQRQEFNDQVAKEMGLEFPVIQDKANHVASAFGLTLETPPDVIAAEKFLGLDLPAHNGSENWDLPMPARYVIDPEFKVKYVSVHVDHRMRNHPRECLEYLKPF